MLISILVAIVHAIAIHTIVHPMGENCNRVINLRCEWTPNVTFLSPGDWYDSDVLLPADAVQESPAGRGVLHLCVERDQPDRSRSCVGSPTLQRNHIQDMTWLLVWILCLKPSADTRLWQRQFLDLKCRCHVNTAIYCHNTHLWHQHLTTLK